MSKFSESRTLCCLSLFMGIIFTGALFTQGCGEALYYTSKAVYYDVDISGDTAVVGSSYEDYHGGYLSLLRRDETGMWRILQTIDMDEVDSSYRSCISVGIFNKKVCAGAEGPRNKPGAVFVFQKHGSLWKYEEKLHEPIKQKKWPGSKKLLTALFGYSTSINGSHLVVGAPEHYSAKAFDFDPASLSPKGDISSPEGGGELTFFGRSLDLDENTLVIGAPYNEVLKSHHGSSSTEGAAFIYDYKDGTWSEKQKLHMLAFEKEKKFSRFGRSVAIDGDTAVIASALRVFLFNRGTNNKWVLANVISKWNRFAGPVVIKGKYTVVNFKKVLYLYKKIDGQWQEVFELDLKSPLHVNMALAMDNGYVIASGSNVHAFDTKPGDKGKIKGMVVIYRIEEDALIEEFSKTYTEFRQMEAGFP